MEGNAQSAPGAWRGMRLDRIVPRYARALEAARAADLAAYARVER